MQELLLPDVFNAIDYARGPRFKWPEDGSTPADIAMRSIILEYTDVLADQKEDPRIAYTLKKGDPHMLPLMRQTLAQTPNKQLMMDSLSTTCSRGNAPYEDNLKHWRSVPGITPALIPWLSFVGDEFMANAIANHTCSQNPGFQHLSDCYADVMQDPRDEIVMYEPPDDPADKSRTKRKRPRHNKHQRNFLTHRRRAAKEVAPAPVSIQLLKGNNGLKTITIKINCDPVRAPHDSPRSRQAKMRLWAMGIPEDSEQNVELDDPAEFLECLANAITLEGSHEAEDTGFTEDDDEVLEEAASKSDHSIDQEETSNSENSDSSEEKNVPQQMAQTTQKRRKIAKARETKPRK